MRRIALNIASIASLLVCLAVCVVWVRSYFVTDAFVRIQPRGLDHRIESGGGALAWMEFDWRNIDRMFYEAPEFGVWQYVAEEPTSSFSSLLDTDAGTRARWFSFAGFAVAAGDPINMEPSRAVSVPHWFISLVLAVGPLLEMRRRLRRRNPAGHCRRCGYDLRETPDRCPECGTVPPAEARA